MPLTAYWFWQNIEIAIGPDENSHAMNWSDELLASMRKEIGKLDALSLFSNTFLEILYEFVPL